MSDDFPKRSEFPTLLAIPTRWMDQDPYGHVNNVEYYSFFDTVVNEHLIREAGLDVVNTPVIGLVVETKCRFMKELSFPQTVHAGMRVPKIGNSSITYEIALFRDDEDDCAAFGHFVHVYVDRQTRNTVRIPDRVRDAVAGFMVG
ncbi:MAG: thioesterase family protein [Alphaproteobacteria bacterium]